MPPGQPIRRCAECRLLRPCKPFDGRYLCVECCPLDLEKDATGGRLAADGGQL